MVNKEKDPLKIVMVSKLQIYNFKFYLLIFIWKAAEKEIERSSLYGFIPKEKKNVLQHPGLVQAESLETYPDPPWVARIQVLELYPTASHGAQQQEAGIKSGAKTWT